MRVSAALVGVGSLVATAAAVANAFVLNKQFYPAMVYLTKSSASMAVIYVQSVIIIYLLFQLFKRIFFGDLRAAEAENLSERAWHAVMETCLAFTVFRDDFSPFFVMQFGILLFVKSFHWLADDRVDLMERSPVITLKFHARMLAIIAFLGGIDSYLVSHAYFSVLMKGASSQIIFGFEYAILITLVVHISIKYILHMHDLRTAQSWENKAVYLLYSELVINFFRCILYGFFALIMMQLHTLPLFSIRPFYISVRALTKAFNDVVLSRRAIHAMNNLFPIVTSEELAAMDSTCIICREEMTADAQPKRLPCSHVFHTHCLRSWFQRQQTCPTCRTDILAERNAANPQAAPQAANVQQAQAPLAQNFIPFLAHQLVNGQQPPQQGAAQPNNQANADTPLANNVGGQGVPQQIPPFAFPPGIPPPFPPFMPPFGMPGPMFMPPPPPAPFTFPGRPSYAGFSDEELAAMEGDAREAVERRLQALLDIYTLLEAAGIQMQQYTNLIAPTLPNFPRATAESTAGATQGSNGSTASQHSSHSPLPTDNSTRSDGGATPRSQEEQPNEPSPSIPTQPQDSGASSSESVPNDASTSNNTAEEIRQRRLNRFSQL
ncbi:unnamed protein product [Auanema sp. JU1783]|nr:unnamed protein product [Auanema sp. JU1783]